MFTNEVAKFITNSMKIELNSIVDKLNEVELKEFKTDLIKLVEYCVSELISHEPHRVEPVMCLSKQNSAEEAINKYALELTASIGDNDKVNEAIDTLRHSFSCFAYNGLHQLYTRQENERWHPRVVLTEILEPNDIETLDETVILYRGCDVAEYESKNFGQAWSTSKERATDFAYRHYASQPWFNSKNRIVLKAIYPRDKVLFSDQSIEFEVVVDPKHLVNVDECKTIGTPTILSKP
ncbi:hypothetical protein ACK35E_12155 [Aeromonas veronii]|uniref:hypothetical protein n=1 Tax=Aeromonas sp. 603359 TaxID=2712046 RepID=UPI003A255F02